MISLSAILHVSYWSFSIQATDHAQYLYHDHTQVYTLIVIPVLQHNIIAILCTNIVNRKQVQDVQVIVATNDPNMGQLLNTTLPDTDTSTSWQQLGTSNYDRSMPTLLNGLHANLYNYASLSKTT